MDLFIIASAVITFIVFLIVHVILLRRISDRAVIPTFWLTYAGVGVAIYFLFGVITMSRMPIQSALFMIAVSWILFTFLVGNYFMGIFGVMESSIRMRVLGEVVRAGSTGVSRKTLLTNYNHTKIIDKRLARFVASGDIELIDGSYVSRKSMTFFLLPAMVLHLVWWLYGRTNIVYSK